MDRRPVQSGYQPDCRAPGALANQQWSFAGCGDNDVNAMLIQPFLNYNLKKGWYLSTAPIMTANW